MVRTSIIIITLLSFVFAIPAGAQDYVWAGWEGPDYTNPAWGHEWVDSQNFFHNGWGQQWQLGQDPADFYPNMGSTVTIPAGFIVDIEGGQPAYCANLQVPDGGTLLIPYSTLNTAGPTMQVDGLLHMTSYAGSNGTVYLHAPLSVEGTGTVLMTSGRFIGDGAIDLAVGPEMTIRGAGSFGWTPYGNYLGVNLTNSGTILATQSDAVLTLLGMDVVNTGTVGAQDGAELRLYGQWDGHGGEITAASDALVYLYSDGDHTFHMEGGVFRTDGGEIRPSGATVRNVSNEGDFHVTRYSTVHMSGTFTNDGLVDQGTDGWAGNAEVMVDSALTIDGEGGWEIGQGNHLYMRHWPDHQAVVTNATGHTIHSQGSNFGKEPDYYGDRRIELRNEGTLLCDGNSYGCTFNVAGEGLVNTGDLVMNASAATDVLFRGELQQREGRMQIDDRVNFLEGGLSIQGGTFAGFGNIQGPVEAYGGAVIQPGGEGAIGTLTFGQNATFTGELELVLEKSPAGMDRLNIGGTLYALGSLTVRLQPLARSADKAQDVVLISAGAIEGDGEWNLILPEAWESSGLEVVDGQLVVRDLLGGISSTPQIPAKELSLNAAPNPFNPRTEIRFTLEEPGFARLWVADLQGRKVAELLAETRGAGEQRVLWEGTDARGRTLGSGVYLCVLETAEGRVSRRLTLVR